MSTLGEPQVFVTVATVVLFLVALSGEFIISRLQGRKNFSGSDSATNLTLYAGYLVMDFLWVPVVYAAYSFVHAHSLTKLGYQWWLFQGTTPTWHWLLLIVADDFCFYWFHRTSHKVWLLWASHENHHSSNHFNLSVAARQTWTPFLAFLFWLPLAFIGFDPLMMLTVQLFSFSFQAMLHTQLIRSFGLIDWILNSPSHHRVHHGSNPQYLDKNFGGIFIVWDRLFGTFEPEGDPVVFGTGETLEGYTPVRAISMEYVRLFKAVVTARGFRKLKTLFKTPGMENA